MILQNHAESSFISAASPDIHRTLFTVAITALHRSHCGLKKTSKTSKAISVRAVISDLFISYFPPRHKKAFCSSLGAPFCKNCTGDWSQISVDRSKRLTQNLKVGSGCG